MNAYVVDTSTAVAWYLPETFAVAARRWQRQLLRGDARLFVPSLHFWEFGNVLRTQILRQAITPDDAQEIYDVHLDAPLEEAEPDRAKVLETALQYQCTVYDAVYVALAESLDAPLITAEKKTRPWVVRLGPLARTLTP